MEDQAEDVLGLSFSAGFKFQPDDDELVEHFLLRRVLGQQLPLEGIIIEDDPLSAPPWELLDKHKRKDDEAFFFANGQPIDGGKSGRQKRTCVGGGCWQGQKPIVDGDTLRVADSGLEITWRKYMLNFHPDSETGSVGWVMHEYSITAPVDLASSSLMRLYSIRFSGHGQSAKREPEDYARAKALKEHSSAANSVVFPPMAAVDLVDNDHGGSARPAAPSYSDQENQSQWVNAPHNWPQMVSYQDVLLAPDSFFLPGADVGDYAGASSHQDFVGGNRMNLGAPTATPSSDQGAPGVMNAAAAAGMLAPFMDQGSFSGAIDESCFMDLELPEVDFNVDELLEFLECGLEAPLHDQYSSAGMETQSYMQLS